MSMAYREWADAYRIAATDTNRKPHLFGKKAKAEDTPDPADKKHVLLRTQIKWRSLPGGRGRSVQMSPAHGHVFMALVMHSHMQDLDDDSILSTASANQLAETCFWSVSQVEAVLAELKQVGLIQTKRRFKKSNITRVFRTAGNYLDLDADFEDVEDADEFEATQQKQAAAAMPKADPNRLLAKEELLVLAEKIQAAIDPYSKGDTPEEDAFTTVQSLCDFLKGAQTLESASTMTFIRFRPSEQEMVAKLVRGYLPSSIHCIHKADFGVSLVPEPKLLATRALTLLTGRHSEVRAFPPSIADRDDLSMVIWWALIGPNTKQLQLVTKLTASETTNPAGYLVKSLPALCEQFDQAMAKLARPDTDDQVVIDDNPMSDDVDDDFPAMDDEYDEDAATDAVFSAREAAMYADPY